MLKKLLNNILGNNMPDFEASINGAFNEAIQGVTLYAIIGLLLAIITLFILNTVSSLKPKRLVAKIFNYINFIYLPVLFSIVFGGFGAINFSKQYALKQIPDEVIPSLQLIFLGFQFYLNANENRIEEDELSLKDAVIEFANSIQFSTNTDSWLDQKKVEIAQKEIPLMLYRGVEAMVLTEKNHNDYPNQNDIKIAKKLPFLKFGTKFWNETQENMIRSTILHFNLKMYKWGVFSLIMSLLLFFEFTVLKLVKKIPNH